MCLFVSISMSRLLSPYARKSILASPEDEAVVVRERLIKHCWQSFSALHNGDNGDKEPTTFHGKEQIMKQNWEANEVWNEGETRFWRAIKKKSLKMLFYQFHDYFSSCVQITQYKICLFLTFLFYRKIQRKWN